MELKYIAKQNDKDKKIVQVKNVAFGGEDLIVIAGPCAVESQEQILLAAEKVKDYGAQVLRGGAFKPRTSPYSFQGLGEDGLRLLREAGDAYGLPTISEVMDTRDVELVGGYVDILQIGSRNMQNFSLLREVGKFGKPVMLKRGMAATLQDWLMAAEYIAYEGNQEIILCERGIRTFETITRNTLDLSVIPIIQKHTKLPVIVDPSHGTGVKDLVLPMSRAAIAVGAHGIMIEIHPSPCDAMSDGAQSLDFEEFKELMQQSQKLYDVLQEEQHI